MTTQPIERCDQFATYLRQRASDEQIALRPLGALAYPTSIVGNTAGALVSTISCAAAGVVDTAKKLTSTEGRQQIGRRTWTVHLTPALARIQTSASRALRPYPYRSVQLLFNTLLDTSLYQAKQVLEQFPTTNDIHIIEGSDAFNAAIETVATTLSQKHQELIDAINRDITYARQSKHPLPVRQKLASLQSTIVHSLGEDIGTRYNSIFRTLLFHTIAHLLQPSENYHPVDEVLVAIGRLLLTSEERKYRFYLENLVQKNVLRLLRDERAMRILGDGIELQGKNLFVQNHEKAIKFVAIYTTIEEIQDSKRLRCFSPKRRKQLEDAEQELKKYLSNQTLSRDDNADGKLILTHEAIQSDDSNSLLQKISALADDLYLGDTLKLITFDLSSFSQLLKTHNQFHHAYCRGKEARF